MSITPRELSETTTHIDTATTGGTSRPPARLRFLPPEASGWPAHWPRPTPADLVHLEDQYRRGFLPPHAPVLRQPVSPLHPGSGQCHQVVSRLWQAMREQADAGAGVTVGLAAPQLGIAAAAVLFDPRPEVTGPPTLEELRCVINPAIQPVGDDRTRDMDGCLSTGTLRGWVTRAARVRLIGATPDGETVDEEHTGHAARVLQHECDHLKGIRFPERTADGDLLWASEEQAEPFLTYVRAARRGETVHWDTTVPPDLWDAVRDGLPAFGTLTEPESQ